MNVIHVNFKAKAKDDDVFKAKMERIKDSMEKINKLMRALRDSRPIEVKANNYDQETLNINERHDIEQGGNTLS